MPDLPADETISELVDVIALIDFTYHCPTGRFFVQARLQSDDEKYPYGQWSLGVVPLGSVGKRMIAYIGFISPDAPKLFPDLEIQLFWGTTLVGTATVKKVTKLGGARLIWSCPGRRP